jgi:hypothetical protein
MSSSKRFRFEEDFVALGLDFVDLDIKSTFDFEDLRASGSHFFLFSSTEATANLIVIG